jgi:hypothetical protein
LFERVSTQMPPQSVGVELGQTQLPLAQTLPPRQTVPQAPQFIESLLRSVQVPLPQLTVSAGQQTPFEQLPVSQGAPQAPQLLALLWVFTQEPPQQEGAAVVQALSQAPQWVVLFRSVQVPLQQPSPSSQAFLQAPQLLVVWRSVHVPLQQPWPVLQALVQEPQ